MNLIEEILTESAKTTTHPVLDSKLRSRIRAALLAAQEMDKSQGWCSCSSGICQFHSASEQFREAMNGKHM